MLVSLILTRYQIARVPLPNIWFRRKVSLSNSAWPAASNKAVSIVSFSRRCPPAILAGITFIQGGHLCRLPYIIVGKCLIQMHCMCRRITAVHLCVSQLPLWNLNIDYVLCPVVTADIMGKQIISG